MDKNEYEGCKIVDIKRGKGSRSHTLYAKVVDKDGGLLIAATLDYIMKVLPGRLP